jgi:hypothetical protein
VVPPLPPELLPPVLPLPPADPLLPPDPLPPFVPPEPPEAGGCEADGAGDAGCELLTELPLLPQFVLTKVRPSSIANTPRDERWRAGVFIKIFFQLEVFEGRRCAAADLVWQGRRCLGQIVGTRVLAVLSIVALQRTLLTFHTSAFKQTGRHLSSKRISRQ